MADAPSKPASRLPQLRGALPRPQAAAGTRTLASTRVTRQSLSAPDLRKVGAVKATSATQPTGATGTQMRKVAALNLATHRKRPAPASNGPSAAPHGGKRPLIQSERNKQAVKPVPGTLKVPPANSAAAERKPAKWDIKGRLEHANERITRLVQEKENLEHASAEAKRLKAELDICKENYNQTENELRLAKETIQENIGLAGQNKTLNTRVKSLEGQCEELTEKVDQLSSRLNERNIEIEDFKHKINCLTEANNKGKCEVMSLMDELHSCRAKAELQKKQHLDQIFELQQLRRTMHNQILDLKGNIRVFCRVRPPLNSEKEKKLCSFIFPDEATLEVKSNQDSAAATPLNSQKSKFERTSFSYDKVFGPDSSQDDLYVELSQLVQSALDGYNVCIFAYGQTGSGKTYTMEGGSEPHEQGMIPRAVKTIFESIGEQRKLGWDFTVKCSFLEIYNENIKDLLSPNSNCTHDVKMADAEDVYVSNIKVEVVPDEDTLYRLLAKAQKNRFVAATVMNEHSSRSHSIAQIKLEGYNAGRKSQCRGTLNLIDLAGSEKYRLENQSHRQIETCNINKSLTSLSLVVLKLAEKADHIPFRDSKLTHLLMPSLRGNSKTLMLVNIAPFEDCFNETMSSLRFAARVSQVKVNSKRQIKTSVSSFTKLTK